MSNFKRTLAVAKARENLSENPLTPEEQLMVAPADVAAQDDEIAELVTAPAESDLAAQAVGEFQDAETDLTSVVNTLEEAGTDVSPEAVVIAQERIHAAYRRVGLPVGQRRFSRESLAQAVAPSQKDESEINEENRPGPYDAALDLISDAQKNLEFIKIAAQEAADDAAPDVESDAALMSRWADVFAKKADYIASAAAELGDAQAGQGTYTEAARIEQFSDEGAPNTDAATFAAAVSAVAGKINATTAQAPEEAAAALEALAEELSANDEQEPAAAPAEGEGEPPVEPAAEPEAAPAEGEPAAAEPAAAAPTVSGMAPAAIATNAKTLSGAARELASVYQTAAANSDLADNLEDIAQSMNSLLDYYNWALTDASPKSVATEGVGGWILGWLGGALMGPFAGAGGAALRNQADNLRDEINETAKLLAAANAEDAKKALAEGKITEGDFTKAKMKPRAILEGAVLGTLFGAFYTAYQGHKVQQLSNKLEGQIKQLKALGSGAEKKQKEAKDTK